MQGYRFKTTMMNDIDRKSRDVVNRGISFYLGAITALWNCGVMTDDEFWDCASKLTDIEVGRDGQSKL